MSERPVRRPFWLPSSQGSVASWLHIPPGPWRRGGVVLCPPMGHEHVHSYRTLLHLADRLAAAGLLALRFDYHGTGASPGDAFGPRLVEAWVDDVLVAATLLSDLTGHASSLLGLRLGATMAALAASKSPVANLVVWAPVVRGRSYVRESEAVARVSGESRSVGADYIEAGGFLLSDQTAEDLQAVDLTRLSYRIGGEVLVLDRDDLPEPADFPATVAAQGIAVHVVTAPGYAGMMAEPQYTVVPDEAISRVTRWLSDKIPADASPPPAGAVTRIASLGSSQKTSLGREELLELPGPVRLFGVHTAVHGAPRDRRPMLLMLNSGSVHQVGPNRVYVELARALAAVGFSTLRLDLRNLGDSLREGQSEENHPYPETALDDLSRAVQWAGDELGYKRIVVGGICSGAYSAFHGGMDLADPRLVGTLVVNPLTFYWHRGLSLDIPTAFQAITEAKYYEAAARDPKKWVGLFKGEADIAHIAKVMVQLGTETVTQRTLNALEALGLRSPPRLAKDLMRYRATGRRLDFVFSRSDPGYGILMQGARRTVKALSRDGVLSVSFVENADHTFSRLECREHLEQVVINRLSAYTAVPTTHTYT